MRNYKIDFTRYSFLCDDEWGDYDNGRYRKPHIDKDGYAKQNYLCTDGKWHVMNEHIAKWEYFNGDIPDGLQIDHIIPVKNGGTNRLSNLRLATIKENANNPISRVNQKISAKKLWENGNYRSKMLEIHSSDEYRKKQSISHKGKKGHVDKDVCKKVYQYDGDNLIAVYESLHDAARKSGFNRERISTHCADGAEYKGYRWCHNPM